MLCVVVSCCVKFASDQKCLDVTTNVVRQDICFVFSDVVCCSPRLTALQTLLSSLFQRSLAKCPARLTTPQMNNMQQMVNKRCVLFGEKMGSFDRDLKFTKQ